LRIKVFETLFGHKSDIKKSFYEFSEK